MSTCIAVTDSVERWGVFEIALEGKTAGNPFTDYEIKGAFQGDCEHKCVDGFYDEEGVYRVRFMPSFTGEYTYKIYGSFRDGDAVEGRFMVTPAGEGNHGPVRVSHVFHFAYEDGTP